MATEPAANTSIQQIANQFTHLFYKREWPGEVALPIAGLTIEEAYRVQDLVVENRLQRGEHVAGYKIGCVSEAIRQEFGLDDPTSGRMFSPYVYEDGIALNRTHFVNCAMEPELVFMMGKDLEGKGHSYDELLGAIEWVGAAIELHHYRFWFSPPSSQELICSGGIHAGVVVGKDCVSPQTLTFKDERISLYKDGQLLKAGVSSDIMGNPIHSLRWLVDSLAERGQSLKKGMMVIPGSAVSLTPIEEDTILRVEIESVGSVSAHFHS